MTEEEARILQWENSMKEEFVLSLIRINNPNEFIVGKTYLFRWAGDNLMHGEYRHTINEELYFGHAYNIISREVANNGDAIISWGPEYLDTTKTTDVSKRVDDLEKIKESAL